MNNKKTGRTARYVSTIHVLWDTSVVHGILKPYLTWQCMAYHWFSWIAMNMYFDTPSPGTSWADIKMCIRYYLSETFSACYINLTYASVAVTLLSEWHCHFRFSVNDSFLVICIFTICTSYRSHLQLWYAAGFIITYAIVSIITYAISITMQQMWLISIYKKYHHG